MQAQGDTRFRMYDRLVHLSGFLYCLLLNGIVLYPQTGFAIMGNTIPVVFPVLATLTLIPILCAYYYWRPGMGQPLYLCLLLALLLLSASMALPQDEPLQRTLAVASTGLCGFLGGMLFFNDKRLFTFLISFLSVLLALFLCLCYLGVAYRGSTAYPFIAIHKHVQLSFLLALSLGPLYLAFTARRLIRVLSILLLAAAYLSLYFLEARFGMILPVVMLPFLAMLTRISFRQIMIIALVGVLVVGAALSTTSMFTRLAGWRFESVYYRLEAPFYGIHILKDSPGNLLFGVGMRSDKLAYLEGYATSTPRLQKDTFIRSLERIRSLDSTYLSLLVDVGLPFFLLYFGGVAIPLVRGVRMCRRSDPPREVVALTLLACAMLLHFAIYEGLYNAFVSYLFHLPLGLLFARTSPAIRRAWPWEDGPSDGSAV